MFKAVYMCQAEKKIIQTAGDVINIDQSTFLATTSCSQDRGQSVLYNQIVHQAEQALCLGQTKNIRKKSDKLLIKNILDIVLGDYNLRTCTCRNKFPYYHVFLSCIHVYKNPNLPLFGIKEKYYFFATFYFNKSLFVKYPLLNTCNKGYGRSFRLYYTRHMIISAQGLNILNPTLPDTNILWIRMVIAAELSTCSIIFVSNKL